jgi:hypothetical protein
MIRRGLGAAASLIAFSLSSQTFISTDPAYMRVKGEGDNALTAYKQQFPDTSIDLLSQYLPRNFLGNAGLPSPDYVLRFKTEPLGFRIYPSPLNDSRFLPADVTYYRTKGPFARLTGVAGSRGLQVFQALYTQTFKRKVNLAIRFNRYTSTGFYKRQQSYTNNLYVSSNFSSMNDRWGYYLYILNNGNKNQENGGLSAGTLNDSTVSVRKELLRWKLSAASRDNNETSAMINPWLRLNGGSDSTAAHIIQLKSRVTFSNVKYLDKGITSDAFYFFAFLDSAKTRDSLHLLNFRNELSYTFRTANRRFGWSTGYTNEANAIWQHYDSTFSNHIAFSRIAFGRAGTSDTAHFGGTVSGEYIVAGAMKNNLKAETHLAYASRKWKIFADGLYEVRSPDYMYNTWVSNHFYWTGNGYKPQKFTEGQIGLAVPHVTVSAFATRTERFLYFDSFAIPRQEGAVNNVALRAAVSGVFFKHLGLFAEHIYQYTTRSDVVRIPPNVFTGRLYYTGFLFRNNLQLQLGGQLQIYDVFYPYAYMPAIQVFHLQNSFSTDPYPFVDIYLHARIRPVSFFFKVENLLQPFAGTNYALVRGYYQPDRAFRLGISWMFFD